MVKIDKQFVVCGGEGCLNVLGCINVYGKEKVCQNDCDKEQFFRCTFEKDMVEAGDAIGEIITKEGSTCDFCPDTSVVIEDCGPVAVFSS